MTSILRLRNAVQSYAWGSRTAIADLLGQPAAAEPQAELWMGAHPKAPSRVEIDGAWRSLDAVIAENGEAILGAAVHGAYDGRLPFLFKVLAAGRPLSIQAHPDKEQAREGFARDNGAGLDLLDPTRNYRDANHKPEILYALTPFVALRGFWPEPELDRRLALVGLSDFLPSAVSVGMLAFLEAYLALEGEALEAACSRALQRASRLDELAAHWLHRLHRFYPGDRGILAPVVMRLLELSPGQALFTGPGVLHAYLDGLGVELMANSDNVLRGGLTAKHVDPSELLRIARFDAESGLVEPSLEDGVAVFETPADEFRLAVVRSRSKTRSVQLPSVAEWAGVRIFLCTDGSGQLLTDEGREHAFSRGDSFLVPATTGALAVCGETTLFQAEVFRCRMYCKQFA